MSTVDIMLHTISNTINITVTYTNVILHLINRYGLPVDFQAILLKVRSDLLLLLFYGPHGLANKQESSQKTTLSIKNSL